MHELCETLSISAPSSPRHLCSTILHRFSWPPALKQSHSPHRRKSFFLSPLPACALLPVFILAEAPFCLPWPVSHSHPHSPSAPPIPMSLGQQAAASLPPHCSLTGILSEYIGLRHPHQDSSPPALTGDMWPSPSYGSDGSHLCCQTLEPASGHLQLAQHDSGVIIVIARKTKRYRELCSSQSGWSAFSFRHLPYRGPDQHNSSLPRRKRSLLSCPLVKQNGCWNKYVHSI